MPRRAFSRANSPVMPRSRTDALGKMRALAEGAALVAREVAGARGGEMT